MTHPAMTTYPRGLRRKLLEDERRARARGNWGAWEQKWFMPGTVGLKNWPAEITTAYRNQVFAVLVRKLPDGGTHFAISSLSGERPTFHEMQRIKNELAGPDKTAIEIYPPASELVDDADMFHLWVLPAPLPYSIFVPEERR